MVPLVEVLVLAAVLLTGVAVFVRVQNSNKSAKVVDEGGVKKKAKPVVTPPAPAKCTPFKVPEVGVQFCLTDDIKDVVYVAKKSDNTYAYFSSTSVVQAGGAMCKADDIAPLGAIGLVAEVGVNDSEVKKLGGKSFTYAQAQANCTEDQTAQDLITKQRKSFRAALDNAELIP